MAGVIITVVLAFVFLVLSVVFFCGKGSVLISGYNTLSPDEKEKYDEKKLCKAVGVVCAVCFVMFCSITYVGYNVEKGLMDETKLVPLVITFLIVLTATIISVAVYTNKYAKK